MDAIVTERGTTLEEALKKAGRATVPHLLEVLGTNPWRAFLADAPDVSALMQVAAVRGIGLAEAKEATPYLVLHSMATSFTLAGWAAGTLARWTGSPGFLDPAREVVRSAVDDWWSAHRSEHAETTRWLARDLLRSIHGDLADDLAGRARRPGLGTVVDADVSALERLAVILGRELPYPVEAPVELRLKALSAFEATLDE